MFICIRGSLEQMFQIMNTEFYLQEASFKKERERERKREREKEKDHVDSDGGTVPKQGKNEHH